MGIIERFLIFFSGYSPKTCSTAHPDEREPLCKIGGAVIFSTTIAACNWAIAGHTLTENQSPEIRLAFTAIASVFGTCLVLLFDRTFIYLADTAEEYGFISKMKAWVTGLFRLILIVLVSMSTSQCLTPILLKNELLSQKLKMLEVSETARNNRLTILYDLPGKKTLAEEANAAIVIRRKELDTLPADLQKKLQEASSCWNHYNTKKKGFIAQGLTPEEARKKLKDKAFVCSRDEKTAQRNRDAYFEETRRRWQDAVAHQDKVAASLQDANSAIQHRMSEAANIEQTALNPASSVLLAELLKDNPGARVKYWIITIILTICEMLPIFLKLIMGKTMIGKKLSTNRQIASLDEKERLIRRKNDNMIVKAVADASLNALEKAVKSDTVKEAFLQSFEFYASALGPMESVRAMIEEIRVNNLNIAEAQRKFPDQATIIGEAWARALAETSEMLTKSFGSPTAASWGKI